MSPATRRCHSPPHSHPARGPTGASLHPVKKHRVADYAAWPPLGPQPQHRSLFLCSSTPATDRSASPLSLPPLAAGKGHLRLGEGRPMGPWVPWHPAEAFTPAVAPRALLSLVSLSPFLLLSIHRDKWQSLSLDGRSGSQSILSLFFPSLVSCLRLSHTRIPVSPWGARCFLLWSNLSAPTLSVSVCVCQVPYIPCVCGVPESRWSRQSVVGMELCTPF